MLVTLFDKVCVELTVHKESVVVEEIKDVELHEISSCAIYF